MGIYVIRPDPLRGNGSVATFPRQRTRDAIIEELLEMVFSIAPRPEDIRTSFYQEERNLINASQFGFLAVHNMTLQCMRLADHVTLNFNSNMSMAAVFLDI
jgi:hypothetical protein